MSRISTVVPGTYEDVSKLLKQILKVPYVISADDITKTPYVERELMLIKVVCARARAGGSWTCATSSGARWRTCPRTR